MLRLRITLRGAVQGVGFRPFVYRLATELSLTGWVLNSSAGLVVEVEGPGDQLSLFARRLEQERPKASVVTVCESAWVPVEGSTHFEILASDHDSGKTVNVLPDLATCTDCREELFDPGNRRFEYPFTNCTNCGPRYTIVLDIPYDRPNTTMRTFTLCPACRKEYENPANRRFHAQPNACPVCGPKLDGTIEDAVEALVQGEIVALKGIGGFQLLVDARNRDAVARLRQRKHREEKPFALMMPSLEVARSYCEISPAEVELLESQAAPIVLLQPRPGTDIAANVAHCSPYLGVMLPYSPLHHLLMQECRFPLIATSGNRSDEPIAIGNDEAKDRLKDIADHFLMHNRPIVRACDDSVVRLTRGRAGILRRARGYAPLGVRVAQSLPAVLAVGGHLKNTVAIGVGQDVFLSQHVGDLETVEARGAFEKAIDDLCRLYSFKPEVVACDLHPDYASTHWAENSGLPLIRVQHHQAHVAACAAENNAQGPYLGVSWDGTGYGLDGAIWGGEFFRVEGNRFERIAHLRPFGLPGGDAAVREGWRSAASLLFAIGASEQVNPVTDDEGQGKPRLESTSIRYMLERGVNVTPTTSVGRLFDAVASIVGVAQRNRFEGQAAMLLENEIGPLLTAEAYALTSGDWGPLIRAVVADKAAGVAIPLIAARFHNALIGWIVEVATQAAEKQIVLSGGVFQNRYLTEHAAAALESRGFEVHTHQRVPPNDGGIALGQAVMSTL
ncbi:MAG TPA: carbamoyltransferase HypF [Candidatus Sulfotelmatobacter sp.]|jgi:hydrogenase maturation protein HypF|nr:carbamoyltransferase HypF [Candidatus Sulfotelmatobacter sp.]